MQGSCSDLIKDRLFRRTVYPVFNPTLCRQYVSRTDFCIRQMSYSGMRVLSNGMIHPAPCLCKSFCFSLQVNFTPFLKSPASSSQSFMGQMSDWKMGGLKSPLNRAQSTLKLGYFSKLRGRPKKAEPQACKIQKRMRMGALLAWQAWLISAMYMSNSKILSRGQWEEQVWCAEGRHCCLGRAP